jgi:hypothetical protein
MRIVQRQREMDLDKKKKKKKKKVKTRFQRKSTRKIITLQAEKNGWTVKREGEWKLNLTKPFTNDLIKVDILKQGIVKFDTPGKISAVNHANAENFLQEVTSKLGAKVLSVIRKMGAAAHNHLHHHHGTDQH